MRELTDWLSAYEEYTDGSEPPLLYHKWCGVMVLASCLQRKVWLQQGFVTDYPNFYVVLVGPSGRCRKGTAMAPAIVLLGQAGVETVADSITWQELIVQLEQSTSSEVDVETGETITHSSLTVFSTELGVFLGEYKEFFINGLTDLYDCKNRWRYATKASGKFYIDSVWLSILGAITPEVLKQKLGDVSLYGGLTSRMIFVYAEDRRCTNPKHTLSPYQTELGDKLLLDMERIIELKGEFQVTDEWMQAYGQWYVSQAEENPFQNVKALQSYVQRRQTHVKKLSMIMSVSRSNEMILRKEDFDRALTLLGETEKFMPFAFSGVGRNELAVATEDVIRTLMMRGTMTTSELLQIHYQDISKITLDDILDQLEQMKWIERVVSPQNRTTTITWIGGKRANESRS